MKETKGSSLHVGRLPYQIRQLLVEEGRELTVSQLSMMLNAIPKSVRKAIYSLRKSGHCIFSVPSKINGRKLEEGKYMLITNDKLSFLESMDRYKRNYSMPTLNRFLSTQLKMAELHPELIPDMRHSINSFEVKLIEAQDAIYNNDKSNNS